MRQWYICTVKCSNGIEYKTKFPVAGPKDARSQAKPSKREVVRTEKLARETSVDLGQTLNCNWKTGIDEHVIFDFSDAGLEKIARRAGSEDRDAVYLAGEDWFSECFVDKTLRLDAITRYGYVEDLGYKQIDASQASERNKLFPVHEVAFITDDNKRYHMNAAIYSRPQRKEIFTLVRQRSGVDPTGRLLKELGE